MMSATLISIGYKSMTCGMLSPYACASQAPMVNIVPSQFTPNVVFIVDTRYGAGDSSCK
jgi:hypothetical protein